MIDMEIKLTPINSEVKNKDLACPFRVQTYQNGRIVSDRNTVDELFEEFRPCLGSSCMAFYSLDGVTGRCRRLQYGECE